MNRDDFADVVRQKLPQYKDVPTDSLVDAYLSKNPQYSGMVDKPQQGVLGAVGSALKDSLVPNTETALKPLSGSPTEMLGQALSPSEGLTRVGQTLREPAEQAGNAVEKFGQDINAPLTGKIGSFITKTALDPATWMGMSENILSDDVKAQMPKVMERINSIPERATEMGGFNEPTPKPEDLEAATQKVTQAYKDVVNEKGKVLNQFKSESGLPTTSEEKDASIRMYGNKRGLDLDKPLELPKNLKQNAPAMEENVSGATTKDVVPSINEHAKEAEDWIKQEGFVGKDAYAKLAPSGAKIPDVPNSQGHPSQDIRYAYREPAILDANENFVNTKDHPLNELSSGDKFWMTKTVPGTNIAAKSQVDAETLKGLGYDIDDKAKALGDMYKQANAGIPETPKTNLPPMPYKISPTKTPEELNTEIGRFLKNQDYISDSDRVKASTYFQDKISNHVDYTKEGDEMQGLLKSKNLQLRDNIADASPSLAKAKSDFATTKNSLNLISDKLNSQEPGATQAYLKRLFTSKSPAAQDDLRQLAKLEDMSGHPVVQTLFKKFAGQAYGEVLPPRHIRTPFQAVESALTSPRYVATPVMKYGENVLNVTKAAGIGGLERLGKFPLSQINPEAYSALQSIKDKATQ